MNDQFVLDFESRLEKSAGRAQTARNLVGQAWGGLRNAWNRASAAARPQPTPPPPPATRNPWPNNMSPKPQPAPTPPPAASSWPSNMTTRPQVPPGSAPPVAPPGAPAAATGLGGKARDLAWGTAKTVGNTALNIGMYGAAGLGLDSALGAFTGDPREENAASDMLTLPNGQQIPASALRERPGDWWNPFDHGDVSPYERDLRDLSRLRSLQSMYGITTNNANTPGPNATNGMPGGLYSSMSWPDYEYYARQIAER